MDRESIKKVREFYENVICQHIIKPIEINEIYCLIYPDTVFPMSMAYKLKQRAIAVYVQNLQQEVINDLEELLELDLTKQITVETEEVEDIPEMPTPIPVETPTIGDITTLANDSHSEYNPDEFVIKIQREIEAEQDKRKKATLKMQLTNHKKKYGLSN